MQWIINRTAFRRPLTTSNSGTTRSHWTNSECIKRCATNIFGMWHRSDHAPKTATSPPNKSLRSQSIQQQPNTMASIYEWNNWKFSVENLAQFTEAFDILVLPDVSIHELFSIQFHIFRKWISLNFREFRFVSQEIVRKQQTAVRQWVALDGFELKKIVNIFT